MHIDKKVNENKERGRRTNEKAMEARNEQKKKKNVLKMHPMSHWVPKMMNNPCQGWMLLFSRSVMSDSL